MQLSAANIFIAGQAAKPAATPKAQAKFELPALDEKPAPPATQSAPAEQGNSHAPLAALGAKLDIRI